MSTSAMIVGVFLVGLALTIIVLTKPKDDQ